MREQDPNRAAGRAVAESFPKGPELPDPRPFVMTLVPLLAAMLPGATITLTMSSGRARWSKVVTITRPRAQREVREAALAPADGITEASGTVATELLTHLGSFVEAEIAQRGFASLNVGLFADAVAAVREAGWSGEDATRFVVALQRSWSAGRPSDHAYLQTLIDQVREGLPVEPARRNRQRGRCASGVSNVKPVAGSSATALPASCP